VVEIRVNCEQNSLLYLVRLLGEGACHTKDSEGKPRRSCYYRRLRDGGLEFVEQ
jgi:phosphoribosyl-AMP cyclohydrolase